MSPEAAARQQIDEQLVACGWILQNYKAVDLSAGRGIALREVQLKTGPCDYPSCYVRAFALPLLGVFAIIDRFFRFMDSPNGRIRSVHFAILIALLIAPGIAVLRFTGNTEFWFLVGWYALASIATYVVYAIDKRRAKSGGWREPETMLHLFELAGGWPGAFLAQQHLRHKRSKLSFQFVFWLIVAAHQFIAVDFLLGWKMTHAVWVAIGGKR